MRGENATAEQTRGSRLLLLAALAVTGGAVVDGGVAAGAEVLGEKGQDHNVDAGVFAQGGEVGLACSAGLAVVYGDIVRGIGVEPVTIASRWSG